MSTILSQDIILEPYYEIYFGGVKMAEYLKQHITQVEYEDSDSEADLVRIDIADIDFIFSNAITLTKKLPLRVVMGHIKKHRTMLEGEITHIEADFGEDGIPRITIGAIDTSNKMTYVNKSRSWKNTTRSNVVKSIGAEYGFKLDVEGTKDVQEQLTQDDETDASFIRKLADEEGFQFYIISDSNTLHFGNKLNKVMSLGTLYYNSGDKSIRSFSPTFVERNKKEEVEAKTVKSNVSDTTGGNVTSKPKETMLPPPLYIQERRPSEPVIGIGGNTGKVVVPDKALVQPSRDGRPQRDGRLVK